MYKNMSWPLEGRSVLQYNNESYGVKYENSFQKRHYLQTFKAGQINLNSNRIHTKQ